MLDRSARPLATTPATYVRRLKASEHGNFVILGRRVEDYWTHWDGENTVPCITPHEMCPGHKANHPRRWKGFLHIWNTQRRVDEFLELTPVAAQCLLSAVPPDSDLRGMRISVQRANGKKARLTVSVWQSVSHQEMDGMPPPKCPTESVLKLWKVDFGSVGL